ncbi:MAG: DUF547 domain-containing protein [Rhizobiaceae bacterium]|jgi:hypothetical protein|nr:DUF547 domain-containing protein [Rhizobiaceae bacterium]
MHRRTFMLSAAAAGLGLGGMAQQADVAWAASPLRAFKPSGSGRVDHSAFDAILGQFVRLDGAGYAAVDYAGLKRRHGEVTAYVKALEAVDAAGLSRKEAHAYWVNLYNAKTLDVVLERYPVKSIRDINLGGGFFGRGPWSRKMMQVSGTDLSLDDVEHRIVRALFNDPLSHYALNCASFSCPNLMPRAYTAANIDTQMAESARLYVNHPRGLTISDGRITASKIYSWYADDFGGKDSLKDHWLAFATPDKADAIRAAAMGRFTYDWTLNDVARA